jgi:hypothetical protein
METKFLFLELAIIPSIYYTKIINISRGGMAELVDATDLNILSPVRET